MAEFDPCKLYFQVVFLALLLPLASGDCITLDLGMQNRSIPDDKVTASSEKSTANTPAKNGRLNYTSGSSWCAATSDSNPYLQIDLQTLHIICAVSTQGNSKADQWVKNYTLKSSTDGSTWKDYEENGQVKSLQGNNNRNSEVKHILYEGVLARYMRFLPKTHQGSVCMRTEVFGVKQKPENIALGKPTAQSSTYSGSSGSGESKKAVDGNPDTNFSNGHCTHTTLRDPNWWRVDLGSDTVPVSAIYIVNRFSSDSGIQQRSKDYKITLGGDSDVTNNTVCVGLYSFINFKASAVCFTNPLKTGRYVGIMTTKSQVLHLCEVEIYSRENLAFGKPTAQFSGQYKDGKSSKAVDGNSNTHFQSGTSKGSCTMTNSGGTTQPWWRVDLRQDESVSEVYIVNRLESDCTCGNRLDDFDIRVGSTSSGGGVTNPRCGGSHSVPTSEGASFFCHPSLKGRYVTIKRNQVEYTSLTLCEVEVYSERRACPMQAIGVASSDAFPNNTFSASSSSGSNVASKGRLNADGAWLPNDDNNANDYLQIDLQYEFVICAVATQGNSNADEWTTKYKLQLSLSTGSINWFTYQENKADKVFNGNSGRNDIVKHSLKEFASARFIRFLPTSYSTHKALRVEVFGILLSAVPSQAPSDLNVTASNSTSVIVSWQLPPINGRHGIIKGYKLFCKKKDSAGSATMLIINNGTTFTIAVAGLIIGNYTEYEFQVLAFTSVGDGPKSSVKVERIKEAVPSRAPSGLNVTASSSTSISASWQLPPINGSHEIIAGYKLFYKKKDTAVSFTMSRINDRAILTKDVTGLEKYTEYEFKVLAFTILGDGPNSSVKVERTKEDVPSQAPTSFSVAALSSTSIKASWQLPPQNSRNGIITGFKLFYREKDPAGPFTMLPINDGAIVTKDVTGLKKYKEYEFKVLAFTSAGDGPTSAVEIERTKNAVPSRAPSGLNVTASSSTSIVASWQLPPINGSHGIIAGYKLFYKKKDTAVSFTMLRINDGAILTKDVTGLEKYTEYEFQVLAFTVVGDGPNSSVKVERTKEDVPSRAPSNFTVTASSSTSIVASWKLPPINGRHGIITGYKLFYKKKDSAVSFTMLYINDRAILTKDVTGLEKYTEYEFQLLAFTIVGDGPNSSVKVERTKEDVPSGAPTSFSVTALSSTSIKASWQLPPLNSRHGIITGFKLFYREKDPAGPFTMLPINDSAIVTKYVTGLKKYTEYEFQVLAFTSVGDGPNSTVKSEITREDAPSTPSSLSHIDTAPSKSHGPRINLTWSAPAEANGIIRSYTVFYSHSGDTQKELSGIDALSYSVDVLGGVTYHFLVRAVTIKPGQNASLTVHTKEYEPSVGPDNVSFSEVNKTTFQISWAPLTREQSYGKVVLYDVNEELLSQGKRRKRSPLKSRTVNTRETFVVLHDLRLCSQYNVSVRAYTAIGPGPYGEPVKLVTSRPDAPWDLKATSLGTTHVSLEWKEPASTTKEGFNYTVKYSGTKTYNTSFKDEGEIAAKKSTTYQVINLVPGSQYRFEVYGTSVCEKGVSTYLDVETKMMAPIAPVVPKANVTDVSVSQFESSVDIHLWPAEQRNGPISAYQVIVLKVLDGAKELPDDYASKLTDSKNANKDNLNFYVAAEIQNDPVHEKPWEFTVGDGGTYGAYTNEGLDIGEDYIVYQRAVTHVKDEILGGDASEVAKISIQKVHNLSESEL